MTMHLLPLLTLITPPVLPLDGDEYGRHVSTCVISSHGICLFAPLEVAPDTPQSSTWTVLSEPAAISLGTVKRINSIRRINAVTTNNAAIPWFALDTEK